MYRSAEVKLEEPDEEDYKPDINDLQWPGTSNDDAKDYKPDLETIKDALQKLEEDVKPDIVTCPVCPERLLSAEFLPHLKSAHPAVAKEMCVYRCPHCRKESFPTNRDLLEHYTDCPKWTQPAEWLNIEANLPFLNMSQMVYCPICVKLCNTFFYLSAHLMNHDRRGSFFQCTGCTGAFKDAYRLKEHLRRSAASSNSECVNSAMVLEKGEAEQALESSINNRRRLHPARVATARAPAYYPPVPPRLRLQNQSHPSLTGVVPELSAPSTRRPRTIHDAEHLETRRSVQDARVKVRHDTPNYRPYHFVPGVPCTSAFNPASRDPAIWSKQPAIKTETAVPKTEPAHAYSSYAPVLVRRQPVLEIAARIATTMPRNRSQMIAPAPPTRGETLSLGAMLTLSNYNSIVICPFCEGRQINFDALDEHLSINHPTQQHLLVFLCHGCGSQNETAEALREHLLEQFRRQHRFCQNSAVVMVKAGDVLLTAKQYLHKVRRRVPMDQPDCARVRPKEEQELFSNGVVKEEDELANGPLKEELGLEIAP